MVNVSSREERDGARPTGLHRLLRMTKGMESGENPATFPWWDPVFAGITSAGSCAKVRETMLFNLDHNVRGLLYSCDLGIRKNQLDSDSNFV